VALYHGANRHTLSTHLFKHEIVLTNYETLRSEFITRGRDSLLYSEEWARIVLDEGESRPPFQLRAPAHIIDSKNL
jgi:SNF2 family DNA or RNA helicase